jgi:Concanavalin A-like lectin/glucanases superfamily
MNSDKILFTETLDINASLGANPADQGIVYEVPHMYADYISVSGTGVVTPIGFPDPNGAVAGDSGICGAMVLIKSLASGYEIGKVMVVVRRTAAGSLEIGMDVAPIGPITAGLVMAYGASKASGGTLPGNNVDPTTSWEDLAGGNQDLTLTNIGFVANDGWEGSGTNGDECRLAIPFHTYDTANQPHAITTNMTGWNLAAGEIELWVSPNWSANGDGQVRGMFEAGLRGDRAVNFPYWVAIYKWLDDRLYFRMMNDAAELPNTMSLSVQDSDDALVSGQPVMISCVWEQASDTWAIYINGVKKNEETIRTNWPTVVPSNMVLGYGHRASLDGDLFQARVYNRKLTDPERTANFVAGIQ